MESLFIQLSDDVYISIKKDPYDWFCGPWSYISINTYLLILLSTLCKTKLNEVNTVN